MGPTRLRIGARPSALALAQADIVAAAIRASLPGVAIEIVRIRTTGDKLKTAALADVGGKGLFIRELENALGERRIDLAVHSMKDLPAVLDARFRIAAVPAREDPRDAIVSRTEGALDGLPAGARVGTASMRRRFQMIGVRPDLQIALLRGNVDTRLNKLAAGEFDAIIVALAGLRRIGRSDIDGLSILDEHDFVPAGGQGALGIEALADRPVGGSEALEQALGEIDDQAARCETAAERAFLAAIGASCVTPVGVHARRSPNRLVLKAQLFDIEGKRRLVDQLEVQLKATLEDYSEASAAAIGVELGRRMLARGAAEMVAR